MWTVKVKIINQRKIHKVVRAVKRKVETRDSEYLKRKNRKPSLSRKSKRSKIMVNFFKNSHGKEEAHQ